jgi:outer membrane usher protein
MASSALVAMAGLLPASLSAQPAAEPAPALSAGDAGAARAARAPPAAGGRTERLVLAIRLNGRITDVVSEVRRTGDGVLSVPGNVLRQLGLLIGGNGNGDGNDWVNLAAVEGVQARLDGASQALVLDAVGSAIQLQVLDAQGDVLAALPAPPPAYGSGTLSYDAFLESASAESGHGLRRPDLSLSLQGEWARGAHGFLCSGLATTLGAGRARWQRLDSAYEYQNPASRDIFRLGDNVSGALAWTRALRLGGLRWTRDFRLRPDLITLPSPQFAGSAAVPSTVDVFVNQALRYSQTVDAGPFVVRQIPVQAGINDTTVVLRDASGRLQQFSLPFVAAPAMLAPGLSEASVELGWPRIGIGSGADRYAGPALVLGSLRHGWTERLTVEAHAEAAAHFAQLGAGAVGSHPLGLTWALALAASRARLQPTASAAAAGRTPRTTGHTVFGSFTAQLGSSSLAAATQRSSSAFVDAARRAGDEAGSPAPAAPGDTPPALSSALPRALDRLQWSVPLLGRRGRASVSWVRSVIGDGVNRTWGASIGLPLPLGGALDAGAAQSAGSVKTRQFWLRLSWNWDGSLLAFASARSRSGDGRNGGYEVGLQKPLQAEAGSIGFSVRAADDDLSGRALALDVQHVTRSAVVEAQFQRGTQGSFVALHGSGTLHGVALTPDGGTGPQGREWLFFAAPYASGAFAVLDLGWPDVHVYRDHSLVGRTDADGRALIPQLEPHQPHSLAIEASDLPLDVHVPSAEVAVTPYWRGAIRVHVPVRHMPDAALVILQGRNGEPLPLGSRGVRVEGDVPVAGTEFVVGHDGRAYATGLLAHNRLRIRPAGSAAACIAEFELTSRRTASIGPLTCE